MTTKLNQLKTALGGLLHTDAALLDERRHDYWVRSHLDDLQGRRIAPPLAVAQPTSTNDVVKIVRTCADIGVGIIPFGLGSGVCGGIIAAPDRLVIDMSKMNSVREIDEVNLLASFDAGRNGLQAEQDVAAKGLTIGHWPQSIGLSSVGGWVATRASGQLSTGYGNIEDIIYSVEAVLPNGDIVTLGKAPRAAAGLDLRHILMGSEGTMGIITGVTFSLRRQPGAQKCSAFHVPELQNGFELQRTIIQSGWSPVVMRQYDAIESSRNFSEYANEGSGLLLMVHEGPAAQVDAEYGAITKTAEEMGFANASEKAVSDWLEKRNHVPHWDDFLDKRIILDTVEISAAWTNIAAIYDEAIERLNMLPDMLNASAHSSHVYRSGINLYFTFAARPDDADEMEKIYTAAWTAIVEASANHGGGIAHHHGIGRVRQNHLQLDLGKEGIGLLRRVKQAIDPDGIMNPGVLLPND